MKEVDWNSPLYNVKPGMKGDAIAWAKAVGKMISMGAAMDAKTLREAALAHHSAILGVDKKGVLTEAQFIEINDRIGHLIASVPEKTTMDVYKSVSALVDPKVPAYLMSTVKEADAKAAYTALQEAAKAHAKAIEGVDAKGVLSQADFEAINTGLGKAIASVPTSTVMDVYNSMAKLVGDSPVPNYLSSKVNPQDAVAAYNGLLEFKDVVKAAQRG